MIQGYIQQLLELALIEPCSGPWDAAVVLVPSDADKKKPRKRQVEVIKKSPSLSINDSVNVADEPKENELDTTYDMMTRQWSATQIEPPGGANTGY